MAGEWRERTRLMVTVGVAVAVNLCVWGLSYKFRMDCNALSAKVDGLKREIKGLEEDSRKETELRQEIDGIKAKTAKKAARVPDEDLLRTLPEYRSTRDELATFMTNAANELKMDLSSSRLDPEKRVDLPGADAQNFVCDISHVRYDADFNALGAFLNKLEEYYPHFVAIEGLNLQAKDGGMCVTGARHQIGFDVVSYRYRRQAAP